MIYVTGDTHGTEDFSKLEYFAAEHSELTENDYVIIAGDFGAVWNSGTLAQDLKPYTDLPFTVLFVDGNHENFPLINTFPRQIWQGGEIHRIRNNVIHLMRGQVYNIDGKTFFTFGGATSIDKIYRRENISWWPQEVPSNSDMQEANRNLEKVNFKVDYIITHSCDERALYYPPLSKRTFQTDIYPENKILSYFEEKVEYKHWYFGHYHMDGNLTEKKTVLYQQVISVND